MICYAYNFYDVEGWTTIYYPYVSEDGYSYVYRFDKTDPENTYEYLGVICMSGTYEDERYVPWTYILFYFNDANAGEEDPGSGVASVEAANKATYYDMQGNKISNPKDGMYIKVVDGKATKVVK